MFIYIYTMLHNNLFYCTMFPLLETQILRLFYYIAVLFYQNKIWRASFKHFIIPRICNNKDNTRTLANLEWLHIKYYRILFQSKNQKAEKQVTCSLYGHSYVFRHEYRDALHISLKHLN